MAPKSSPWGSLGWWIMLTISIPFAFYAAIFIIGDFEVYRKFTLSWAHGKYEIAGLHILHHLRAWQIHATAAELFISTGLFQFSPSFRRKFPSIHRVLGYVFVAAGAVSSITGVFFLVPNTEFGLLAKVVFTIEAFALAYFLFVSVKNAKQKKFQVHQRYMIRAASIGYSTIAVRPFPVLFVALGVPFQMAFELAALIAPILFLGVAELYIQRVLLESKVTTPLYVQTSDTEDPKPIQSSNTHGDDYYKLASEVKELSTPDPQTGWVGEHTGLGSNKAGGWVGEDTRQGDETGGGCEPVNPPQGSDVRKSAKLSITSAAWRGGHHDRRIGPRATAVQQVRTTNPRFGGKLAHHSPLWLSLDRKVPRPTCHVVPRARGFHNQACQAFQPTTCVFNTTFRIIQPTMKPCNQPVHSVLIRSV